MTYGRILLKFCTIEGPEPRNNLLRFDVFRIADSKFISVLFNVLTFAACCMQILYVFLSFFRLSPGFFKMWMISHNLHGKWFGLIPG